MNSIIKCSRQTHARTHNLQSYRCGDKIKSFFFHLNDIIKSIVVVENKNVDIFKVDMCFTYVNKRFK